MVPGAMLARLPVHPGYEWRVAGSDLILVAIATGGGRRCPAFD